MKNTSEYTNHFRILKGGKISLVVSALLTSTTLIHAAPSGGVVTSGDATISNIGKVTNITQSTQKASINWNQFNIAHDEIVNFKQPNVNSITLNRVVGNERSIINGAMNANGQVMILNSNGVLFGKNAKINTAGLLATTKELSDTDFQAGNYNFKGNSTASVINLGEIDISDSGYAVFLAKSVSNEGTIKAVKGSVRLVGANEVTINLNGNSIIELTVHKGVLDALVENKGAIYADAGEIYLTTNAVDELLKGVVNNSGLIEANSVDGITGYVELFAHGGTGNFGGTLSTGKGEGFIETSGRVFTNQADLKVETGNWLIDPVNITIDDTLAGVISTALGTGSGGADVTITTVGSNTPDTSSGQSGTDGDINVNSAISWSSGNDLTLHAHRNININADITASDSSGSLILEYGQGVVNAGNTAKYNIASGKTISLVAGENFTTKLGSDASIANGGVINYTVITSLGNAADATTADTYNSLQGLAHSSKLSGNYVLGATIAATATSGWNSNAGWKPIGDDTTKFTGKFDGLGHTISNLHINDADKDNVGLFGYAENATIKNVHLSDVSIKGHSNVGGLVGFLKNSTLSNSHATGTVTGTYNYAGGLIGLSGGGTITNSYATGTVSGNYRVGGLIGASISGTGANVISNVYANSVVTATGSFSGGLMGQNNSLLSNSYSLGTVTGTGNVGGLVGMNTYFISNSYSLSKVTGTDSLTIAGLANDSGNDGGIFENSYYDKTANPGMKDEAPTVNVFDEEWNVIGTKTDYRGKDTAEMQNKDTYNNATDSTWNVIKDSSLPSTYLYPVLVTKDGVTTWKIYGVDGISVVYNLGEIPTGYTYNGTVQLPTTWTTSTIFDSAYSDWVLGTDYKFMHGGIAITGFTDAGTYSNISIDILKTGFTEASTGNTAGKFIIAQKEVALSTSKVYNGNVNFTSDFTVKANDIIGSDTVTASGALATASKNAGTYTSFATNTLALSNANYKIGTTTADITKKTLTISGITATGRTYDGSTDATVDTEEVLKNGLVNGDILTLTATGTFADKNAGTGKIVNLTSTYAGADKDNYAITNQATATAEITKKALTVSGITAENKTYDGDTTASVVTTNVAYDGLITNDVLTLSATGIFADKNAGTGKTVNLTTAYDGADKDNYEITNQATTTATITQKGLSVAGITASNKTYDGTTTATLTTGTTSLVGLVDEDIVSGDFTALSGAFADKNAGENKAIAVSGVTLSGTDAENYTVSSADATATINKKEIGLVNFKANDKTYDGNTNAVVSADDIVTTDIIDGEQVIFTNSTLKGTFENATVGQAKNVSVADNASLSGDDASNYKLVGTTLASINAAPTPPAPDPVVPPIPDPVVPPTPDPVVPPTPDPVVPPKPDPVEPIVPPKPEPKPQEKQEIKKIVDSITNQTAVSVNLPVLSTNVKTDVKTFNNSGKNVNVAFSAGENKMIVSKPIEGQVTQKISLSEAKQMQKDSGVNNEEVRVPLSNSSIIELVDGGVTLPDGVEQEFYVAETK